MGTISLFLLGVVVIASVIGSPTPVEYDTIVVGMGASGVAAATKLAAAGKKVLGLEAQDRIGGRVHTVPFGDSTVELGAEWIHGIVNSVTYEMALKNNVTILEQQLTERVYRSDGSHDQESLINELNEVAFEAYENLPDEPMSLAQHIKKKINGYLQEKHPEVQNDTDFMNNYFNFLEVHFGTNDAYYSWNDITTKSDSVDLGGSIGMSWHKYGYYTLFDILLNKYNNGPGYPTLDIKLKTEVILIQWPQDPKDNVIVTVADGTKYTAKNVIFTPSIAVLKQKHDTLFSPALPEEKVKSIKGIAMGVTAKIILRWDEIWWPNNTLPLLVWREEDKASISAEDSWLLKVNTPASPMSNSKALTMWTYGEAAKTVEALPSDVVKEKAMIVLRKFMGAGKTLPEPAEIIKSSWYSNPFILGVYTYDDINTPKNPTVRSDLRKPLVDSSGAPRVLFAGEATNSQHFGTVHGAVETGYREANRLLSVENH